MLALLHTRGYQGLYLHSGMSPSGCHWRFEIGVIQENCWPCPDPIVRASIGEYGPLPWTANIADVVAMADGFEDFYRPRLLAAKISAPAYMNWFSNLLSNWPGDLPLIFFADFEAPHQHLLNNAPGYLAR